MQTLHFYWLRSSRSCSVTSQKTIIKNYITAEASNFDMFVYKNYVTIIEVSIKKIQMSGSEKVSSGN
jgi:hypothetical protein